MITLLAAAIFARQTQGPIDLALASRYFHEAKWASDDVGALCPKPLYGPMVFIDPGTHAGVANQPDKEGHLTKQGDVWVGTLPREIGAANTAFQWAGVNWSMIMWPLPSATAERNMLLMHESFHRIQSEIGLPPAFTNNSYLDTKVYPHSTISDDWGTIEISKGARVVQGSSPAVYVSAPTDPDGLSGDGWKLTLKPGWKVVPGTRKGDFTVAKG